MRAFGFKNYSLQNILDEFNNIGQSDTKKIDLCLGDKSTALGSNFVIRSVNYNEAYFYRE